MSKKALLDRLRRWFVKVFWLWFRDVVWPIIHDEVIAICEELLREFRRKIRGVFEERARQREEWARKNAQEAQRKASEAPSDLEADRQEAIAQVWRQVAEDLRRENEELQERLRRIIDDMEKSARRHIERLKPRLQSSRAMLEIGDREVPMLMPPEDQQG